MKNQKEELKMQNINLQREIRLKEYAIGELLKKSKHYKFFNNELMDLMHKHGLKPNITPDFGGKETEDSRVEA